MQKKNIALSVILETNCMGKLKLQLSGELYGVIEVLRQVLSIICIDDSYAKFISPAVQIYLLANSFMENCVWLRVAWRELDKYETKLNNKTECRIFPYKWVSFKKHSYRDLQ